MTVGNKLNSANSCEYLSHTVSESSNRKDAVCKLGWRDQSREKNNKQSTSTAKKSKAGACNSQSEGN